MDFVIAAVFDNYINAHVTLGRLQDEQISCWLKDENTVTIHPGMTYAAGGIKLMVAEPQIGRALQLLAARQEQHGCRDCGSQNVELVNTPRKTGNWLSAIAGALLGTGAVPVAKVYRCFDCGKEYDTE